MRYTVLGGGLPRNCLYLVDGHPDVGKTTLALQFLLEGVRQKEPCLYVTLSETKAELESVAKSHGWDLTGVDIIELSSVERLMAKSQNTMFQSASVELNHLSKLLLDEVERIGLPGTHGYEVARSIRASTSTSSSSIKLIAVTGYGQVADRERSIQSGFDVHLLKPVDPQELERMLASLQRPSSIS